MSPMSQPLSPLHRATLLEFERLHEQWRQASEAADTCEWCGRCDAECAATLLRHRLDADRAHRAAMRLLRERPI